MANNLLVDWLNNKKNNVQTNVLRKSATNTNNVTTPNLPIKPTTVSQTGLNLQKAQQPTQTKLNNINTQTLPTQTNTGVGSIAQTPNQSRFIGFQQQQPQAKSFSKLMNNEYLYIPTAESQANFANAKEENRYRTAEQVIKDFAWDVKNSNGNLTREDISKYYKEWEGNEDAALQLQVDILPLVQQGQFPDMNWVSQTYGELLKGKELKDIQKIKESVDINNKKLQQIQTNIDKTLKTNWQSLSPNGMKYIQNWNTVLRTLDEAKKQGVVGGASNAEIVDYLAKNNPEFNNIFKELNNLELSEMDKAIVGKKDASLLKQVQNKMSQFLIDQVTDSEKPTDEEIESVMRGKEKLENDFWGQTGKKIATEIGVSLDSLEKKIYRAYKDAQNWGTNLAASFIKDRIPKSYWEEQLGVSLTDEEYNAIVEKARADDVSERKQNVLDYQNIVNKEYESKKARNLDPDVENYVNNMGMTRSLLQGNLEAFGYKSAGDMAQNADMLFTTALGAVAPEVVLPLMAVDSYSRESQESFEELMETQKKMGISQDEAYDNAQKGSVVVGLASATVELALEKLLGGVETTASKAWHDAFTKEFTKKATEMVAERGLADVLKQGAATQFKASLEEGLEEVLQQTIHNKAVQQYDPDQKLTEGLLQAFEGGFYNPMNLLAGGGDVFSNIDTNSIKQGVNNTVDNATARARNIVGNVQQSVNNGVNNVRDFMNRKNKVTSQNAGGNTETQLQGEQTDISSENANKGNNTSTNVQNSNIKSTNGAIELEEDTTENKKTAIKEGGLGEKVLESLNGLDENTRERIKKNPYSVEESKNLIKEMDENPGIDFRDYQNGRYEEVLDTVLKKLEQKENKRSKDIGTLYDKLEEVNAPVDVTELKNKVAEFQAQAEALEDIATPAEQAQIKTILENIEKIGDGTMDVWKARKIADKRSKRSVSSSYDGIGLIWDIRDAIDDVIVKGNPDMKEVDKSYRKVLKEIGEIKGKLFYKNGGLKSNAVSTIKNMMNAGNRIDLNNLEKHIPGIKKQLQAIDDSKFVYNAYTTGKGSRFISGIARGVFGNIGKAIGFFTGGWGGLVAGAVVDAGVDTALVKLTRKALRDTITKETAASRAELERISKKIEEGEKLDAQDKARLKELGEKIKRNGEQMAKTKAEKEAWIRMMDENITPQTTEEEQEKNKVTKKKTTKKNKVTEKNNEAKNKVTKKEPVKKAKTTEYINETPQNERGQLEEIEAEENLRNNETPQGDMVEEAPKNKVTSKKAEATAPKTKNKTVDISNVKNISDLRNNLENKEVGDHRVDYGYINGKYYEIEEFVGEYHIVEGDKPSDINHAKNGVAIGGQYVNTINGLKAFIEGKSNGEVIKADRTEENQTKKFTYDEYGQVMNKIGEVEKKINDKLDKQYEQERAEKMSRFEELRDKEDKTDAEGKELVKLQGELNNMSNKYDKLKEDELKKQAPELLQQKEELQQAFDRDWKAAMDKKMEEMEKPFNDLRDEFRQKLRDELGIADDVILDEKYYNSLTPEQKKIADEINKEYAEKYEELRQKMASVKTTEEESKAKITKNKKNKVTNPSKVKESGLFNESEVDKGKELEGLNPDALPLSDYREMQRLKIGRYGGLWEALQSESVKDYMSTQIANEKVGIKPDWDDNEAWDKLPEDFEDDWEAVATDIEDMYDAYEEYLDMKNGGDFDENTLKNTLESANDYANRQFPGKTAKEVIDQYTPQYEADLKIYNRLFEKYPGLANRKIDLTGAEGKAMRELANQENETAQDIDYQELAERENETAQIPTIFEEDSEQMNLRELEENETPQADEEEMNKVTRKESKPKNLVTNKVMENDNTEQSDFETLPDDVTVSQEAKQLGAKRIAPDRVPRQQLTFDEGVNKIAENLETLAEYKKTRDELYSPDGYNDGEVYVRYNNLKKEFQNIMYGNNGFQFKSNKSKEFTDLWKNIVDNKDNKTALREVAKNFYISKVKKDISKGYVYPQEVLDKIPGAKKAIDNRERYEKGLNTSFSAKDERIDYSEKDTIGAGMKSQDGKQITKEQKEDIVKGILDFGKTLGLDMKKFAEDRGLVYVHLHGGLAFLNNMAAGLYRESTNEQGEKNISVSVGGAENVRYKDKKTKERKTTTLNTTMSHELGHAMDYLLDNKLFSWTQKSILGSKYNPVNRLRKYYAKGNEIVARAIEQYVAVENGQTNYYENVGEITSDAIDDPKWKEYFEGHGLDKYVKDYLKEIGSYYERPGYWSKPDYEKYVKPYVEEAFRNNFEEYKINKSQKNVLLNDKNKVTTQAARAYSPTIVMRLDDNGNPIKTSKNKVTSRKPQPTQDAPMKFSPELVEKVDKLAKERGLEGNTIKKMKVLNKEVDKGKGYHTETENEIYELKKQIITEYVKSKGKTIKDKGQKKTIVDIKQGKTRVHWHVVGKLYRDLKREGIIK